jgi:hypothetical protein
MANSKTIEDVPDEVRKLFDKFARDLVRVGWKHYSSDAILHRIRWHYHVEQGDRDFKCNNNWTAYLARWWLERNPEYPEFFELRALSSERFPPPSDNKQDYGLFGRL